MKVTLQDAIKEVRREIQVRKRLYPGWISSGKLNKAVAECQLARMEFALEMLEGKKNTPAGKKHNLNGQIGNLIGQKLQELGQFRINLQQNHSNCQEEPARAYRQMSLEVVESCKNILLQILEELKEKHP